MSQAAAEGTDVRLKGQLLAQGRALLTTVGNQSNLILDPDLDSYYVMSLTVLRFPELLQVLHDSNEFMQRWGKPAGGNNQLAHLLVLAGRLDAVMASVESDYDQATAAGSPQLRSALQAARLDMVERVSSFQSVLEEVANSVPSPSQKARLEGSSQAVLLAVDSAWKSGVVALDGLLQARVERLFSRMWLHLGTALLLLGAILSLVYLVASQIARPLQLLARVADRVRGTADYSHRARWVSSTPHSMTC